MAAMARKLIVEVVEARNLLPKDGMGTSSPFVMIDFDGQRKKTPTILRDLNPIWNEVLEFNVTSPLDVASEPLEAIVYHDQKAGPSRRNNFLGRVRIDPRQFVKKGEEALIHFPLEKKRFFGWIRGDIGLRIYYLDESIPDPSPPPPDAAANTDEPAAPLLAEGAAPAPPAAEATALEAAQTGAPAEPPTEAEPAPPAEQSCEDGKPGSEVPQPPASPETDANADKPTESDSSAASSENGMAHAEATDQTSQTPDADSPSPPQSGAEAQPPPRPAADPEKEAAPKWVPQPRQMVPPLEARERSTYDLVDKMQYLFVRVVRARSLPGGAKPYVSVAAFGRHVSTRTARRAAFFEWEQTFGFARDPSADSSMLEVSVWDLPPESGVNADDDKHFLGGVCFDVSEAPMRDPPDSPLAPQWYRLEGGGVRGADLMLATWTGTQADESFADAWKADAPASHAGTRSKVYVSPKLWYLRATVIEAQDTLTVLPRESGISVQATLAFQVLRTRNAVSRNCAPSWNEDLIFVAAEPFGEDQKLVLSLEIRHGKDTVVLGIAEIPLSSVERRVDDRKVTSRWLDLLPVEGPRKGRKTGHMTSSRLHVRVCLDGGYHVADEPPQSSSDFRQSARQLWRPPVGAVELGIIRCRGLLPMRTVDGKGSTDAFAVAKYGPKWARTRTLADSFDPAWNEQYTWPVYDPCTVLTVAVFDGSKDAACRPMGKVRIRISTLETDRACRGSYPLLLLLPSGVKRMGEIELAVRFALAGSALDLLHMYGQPMLPLMHHLRPIGAPQREPLRLAAARIIAGHLSRSEPSLRREVVMWMLDAAEPRAFSMRKVRANWHRIVVALAWVADMARWVEDTRAWRNPTATMLAHGVLVLLVWYPELVGPTLALHAFAVGAWRYRWRARRPAAHPCVRSSQAEAVDREELDEELDPVPSVRGPEVVRARYDRLRGVAARVQTMLGDVAAQAERVQALVTWQDPRATGIFVALCFFVSMMLYLVPAKMVAAVAGFYYLRHPMFRDCKPPTAINFFRRLPSLSDRII
ncbi:Protein QUIRKY [Cocos nucifera]|nr:Protein QUIRKY [Cocos nucifera]